VRGGFIILLGATLLAAAARPTSAESLVTALSTSEVLITSNFSGTQLTVFGAIQRDAASASRSGDYDLVVVMRGPSEAVVVRRKERVFGIWVNRAAETFSQIPSFYALNASRPLADLDAEPALVRFRLGVDNLFSGPPPATASEREFRAALVRLKSENQRYAEREDAVTFLGSGIFRTTLTLPANVPVGLFSVEVYLFNEGVLLTRAEDTLRISKIGFEQILSGFSRDQALIFGVGCVAMALAISWLAGLIFRRD